MILPILIWLSIGLLCSLTLAIGEARRTGQFLLLDLVVACGLTLGGPIALICLAHVAENEWGLHGWFDRVLNWPIWERKDGS